ncbi:MAG: hypothetical protein PHC44_04700 [Lutispora sp.]|nr:hypothetical protein [Lutispora sp.]
MEKQKIASLVYKHGFNLLKLGLMAMTTAAGNQILKGLTYDTISEVIRDVRKARSQYKEGKQAA